MRIIRTSVPLILNFSIRPKPQAKLDSDFAVTAMSRPIALPAAMHAHALYILYPPGRLTLAGYCAPSALNTSSECSASEITTSLTATEGSGRA